MKEIKQAFAPIEKNTIRVIICEEDGERYVMQGPLDEHQHITDIIMKDLLSYA